MNLEAATTQLLEQLPFWIQTYGRPTIAFDGTAGAGKTTLANEMTRINHQIRVIHTDDYLLPIEERERMISEAEDPVAVLESEWYDYRAIQAAVEKFRQEVTSQALIVEGILMFDPRFLNGLWDVRIYLSGDPDILKDRRIAREKARWGAEYISEDDPRSWYRLADRAQQRYHQTYHPEQLADIVLTLT